MFSIKFLSRVATAYMLIGLAIATLISVAAHEFILEAFLLIMALWPLLIWVWLMFTIGLGA